MKQEKIDQIRAKENEIRESAHFRNWNMTDVSELFWIHLGIYQKEPNLKSLTILKAATTWASHADRALYNSFDHALEWIGIQNIYMEYINMTQKGDCNHG